jgi:hypothetical protein
VKPKLSEERFATWPVLATAAAMLVALGLAGCASSGPTGSGSDGVRPEKGPNGTIAYYFQVEASEPGAKIEANGDYVGDAPLKLKVWGDKDGTFHNFGSYTYTIRAYPVRPGQRMQIKEFKTGGWFTEEDKIPSRIYFDFSSPADAPKLPPN